MPYITFAQWQERGFNKLPNSPPILFQEHLSVPEIIINLFSNFSSLILEDVLTTTQWELLLAVLGVTALYKSEYQRLSGSHNSRRHVIQLLRKVWSKIGERPIATVHHRYDWLYVYGFVKPRTEETLWYLISRVNIDWLNLVYQNFVRDAGISQKKSLVSRR